MNAKSTDFLHTEYEHRHKQGEFSPSVFSQQNKDVFWPATELILPL